MMSCVVLFELEPPPAHQGENAVQYNNDAVLHRTPALMVKCGTAQVQVQALYRHNSL
jgi:hypothetical protein